jgi:hypothetical protein
MSGFTVSGPHVTFCGKYCCSGFEMAHAAENTTMIITSVAGCKYLGRGNHVVFPKGNMYCGCCFSWKSLDMNNKAWAVHLGGTLIEPFLVCEGCAMKISVESLVSQPLCGTLRVSKRKIKSPTFVKRLCKWWRTSNAPQFDPEYQWD